MRSIPDYESFAILERALSPEEIQLIRDRGALSVFQKGRVGTRSQTELQARDSDIAFFTEDPEEYVVIDMAENALKRVNFDKFGMELEGIDAVQYTKYGINQHYDWHIDTHVIRHRRRPDVMRKLSMVIMLTEPDQYEGGDLLLNVTGNADHAVRLRPPAGHAVVFYSHVPHRVEPVTSGERISLVAWATGPRMR